MEPSTGFEVSLNTFPNVAILRFFALFPRKEFSGNSGGSSGAPLPLHRFYGRKFLVLKGSKVLGLMLERSLNTFSNVPFQKNLSIAELMDWQHFPCPSVPGSDFEVMQN